MANRPLPNVDPEALSKLASQYPGSGESRAEPKLGGGSGGSGGSGSGGSGSGGSGSGGSGSGGSGSGSGSGGSAGGATLGGDRPAAGKPPQKPAPQVRTVGRGSVVLAGLFAVVAVAGAVAALAAPSLRTEARALLKRHVPQLSASTVDFITGQDTKRLEITYDGLDQRIARLNEALERAVKAGGDPAVARELLLKTEQDDRLRAAEAAVATQAAAFSGLTGRVDGVEQRLAAFEEIRRSLDGVAARADAADKSLAGLQAGIDELKASLEQLRASDGRIAALAEGLSGRLDTVAAEVARAHSDLSPVATLANQVAEQRRTMELPLIGVTQLRMALDRDTPFKSELALAKKLVGGDAESLAALGALDGNAGAGVTTLPGLRRDFTFVATQMGGTLTRMQSWTQRLSSWVEVLVGTRSVPEADPVGEISAAVASIDAALEAGQLDLAIDEANALNSRRSDVLLDGWIAEARRRLATERAFDRLSERVYARIGNSG